MTGDEQQDYAASHLPGTTSSCLVTSSLSTNTLAPQTQKWETFGVSFRRLLDLMDPTLLMCVLQDRVVNAGPIGDIWWWQ